METVTKQPAEQFPVAVEFFGKLPPQGQTISTATATAIKVSDSSDATSTVIQSGSIVISGTQVQFGVKGGVTATDYKVTVTATLSDNSILEEDFLLDVDEL